MIERRPFEDLPGEDLGWLKARWHFSCAAQTGPSPSGWGCVRVWNDEEIAPNAGFALQVRANMEIIIYVREGAVTHRDSLGNDGRVEAGSIQVVSAGTGIRHAEYNLEQAPARICQMWITPASSGGSPAWGFNLVPRPNALDVSGQSRVALTATATHCRFGLAPACLAPG